jgi:hypothetical protein
MSVISLIKGNLAEILLDNNKNILIIKFTKSNYDEDDFDLLLEYFKNFWILAYEQNKKYFMLFDIKEIGFFPLQKLDSFKKLLISLEKYFIHSLHCSSLLTNNDLVLLILKPLLNAYKAVRPFNIFNTIEEVIIFFNKNKNENLNENLIENLNEM